jgi:hypothetical protein
MASTGPHHHQSVSLRSISSKPFTVDYPWVLGPDVQRYAPDEAVNQVCLDEEILNRPWYLIATSNPELLKYWAEFISVVYTRKTPANVQFPVLVEHVKCVLRRLPEDEVPRQSKKNRSDLRRKRLQHVIRSASWKRYIIRNVDGWAAQHESSRLAKRLRFLVTPIWQVIGLGVIEDLEVEVFLAYRNRTLLMPRELMLYSRTQPEKPWKLVAAVEHELSLLMDPELDDLVKTWKIASN